ncbi:MAG: GNAT family N-acetyltransferase [Pseudomonadota bacterium]
MSLDQITVRLADPTDAPAVAGVHDRAWRSTYRGIIPGVALERMIERRGERWWRRLIKVQRSVLVLEVFGKIAGYVTLGRNRSSALRVRGEIYELYIDPTYQGLGFGRRLFRAARAQLKTAGCGHFVVWVLEANDAAVAFYRAMGGEPVAHGLERFGGSPTLDGETVVEGRVGQQRKLAFVWGGGSKS